MVRSCNEKIGQKPYERNYDGIGQRVPQSRTTEEVMARHDTDLLIAQGLFVAA